MYRGKDGKLKNALVSRIDHVVERGFRLKSGYNCIFIMHYSNVNSSFLSCLTNNTNVHVCRPMHANLKVGLFHSLFIYRERERERIIDNREIIILAQII